MTYAEPAAWHEAANLFPLLPPEDLRELAEDIRENGLQNPIVIHESKVLDGRNRLLACEQAGVKPVFTEWTNTGISPTAWVVSLNLKRRHLTQGQRAAVAVEAKPLLASEAKEHQRLGGDAATFVNADKPRVSEPIDVRKVVANQFAVSQGYVYAAQKIRDASEHLFQRVKSGAISIPEAQKELGFKTSAKAMVASDSNEWYTPENYVTAAKHVLGRIELDPASCKLADKFIKAQTYYTIDDDGLKKKWKGKVWLNPPYGDLGPKFAAKLITEYEAGNVSEAILLVNSHVTDSRWFKPLFNYLLCFTDHRSRFWNQDGVGGAPTHGSVFVYFGENKAGFVKHFKQFGSIVESCS